MQKIRVVDFETTGLPDDQVRGICEVGFTDLTADWKVSETTSFLVNPGHTIPPQTRAIHHISDADVEGAVSPDIACASLMEGMNPDDVFAAHNAKFERGAKWADLPWDYLSWVANKSDLGADEKHTARHHLKGK